jgi:Family of unknown function (DUF6221)
MTAELINFLRYRVTEDEALALEAPQGPWHIGNAVDPTKPCHVHTFPGARMVADGLNWLVAEHIAMHDPARVLAEVEAKRRVLDRYENQVAMLRNHMGGILTKYLAAELLAVVQLLALPYASHPDFREEWRP